VPPRFIAIWNAASVLAQHIIFLLGQSGHLSSQHDDNSLLGPFVFDFCHRLTFRFECAIRRRAATESYQIQASRATFDRRH
jgi:hypothetical protein